MKCQNEARRPRVHYAAPQIGAPLNRLRSVPAPSISRRAAPAGTRSGNEIRFNEPDGLISARKKTRRLHKFLDTTGTRQNPTRRSHLSCAAGRKVDPPFPFPPRGKPG